MYMYIRESLKLSIIKREKGEGVIAPILKNLFNYVTRVNRYEPALCCKITYLFIGAV